MESADIEPYFDEDWYLQKYPDVAQAVREGVRTSGWEHFVLHGNQEGRQSRPAFDAAWYARAYPLACDETGSAEPAVLERHYFERGRYRGYLPNAAAKRPRDGAAPRSDFGGLWIDAGNALDVIAGRRELGMLGAEEAALLQRFVEQGYVVLPGTIDAPLIDRAEEIVESAYDGKIPRLLFECQNVSRSYVNWCPEVKRDPAKAIDLHWFFQAVRDVIFHPSIVRFLHLIFERPALASQNLAFYRGSGQALHQDSAYLAYSLPRQFAASWVALEDVEHGAGELEYFVDSHRRLPEFTYAGGHKSVAEALRGGAGHNIVGDEIARHVQVIQREGATRRLKRQSFLARRGAVLIWHVDLAHGGSPLASARTRKSLVTHYCPREVAPLYFETGATPVERHGRSFYTSSIYGDRTGRPEGGSGA